MREMPATDARTPVAIPLRLPGAAPSAWLAMVSCGVRGFGRLPAWLFLAAATLLVPGLAVLRAAAQPAPAGETGTMTGGAVASPEAGMAAPRMPRPGSSATFEAGRSEHGSRKTAEQRFEAANTTHDGHLSEAQAQAAHMRGVATHFAEIDSHHRGYITLDEIRAWRAERRAERKAIREKAEK